MEKNLFEGMRLLRFNPEERKKEKVIVMRPSKPDLLLAYGENELKNELRALRDFVAFDMAASLRGDSGISAEQLSSALMPLDYLVREVEFKEVEVLV